MSQSGYPKLTLINGDTLILFTPLHVDKMNVTFLELDRTLEINTSLSEEVSLFKKSHELLNKQNENLISQVESGKQIGVEKDYQIGIFESEIKSKDKKIKLLKKTRNLFTIGGVVVGGAAVFLVTKIK